jgi:phosphate:Na+ symporter
MPEIVTTLFGLFGGLALFLYGMGQMSEALQKAAGEKMRSILGFLTKNPLMGALAGALVTAVLQSSSATTVMVIGFVSAGLMGLPQAISVIFGANIGTTMTAQLIAFDISDYIYPILFISFLIQFLAKNEKIKSIGMVFFSFGLLFEGIEIMSSVMKPLASSPIFVNLMGKVQHFPILGILLGMCMTLVVQSSSATIAVLQSFASQAGPDGVTSVIGLTGAIPILLGDNIGTTITALLASVGQSKDAKRTAVAHTCFNVTGTIVFAFLIPWFAKFVQFISPKGPEVEVISRQIANAHTTFNIVCTLVWLPLIAIMVKIVCFIVPDRPGEMNVLEESRPKFLDLNMTSQPQAALILLAKEIRRSLGSAATLLDDMKAAALGRNGKELGSAEELQRETEAFRVRYQNYKAVQASIGSYITELFSKGSMTPEQSEQASDLLSVANDVDRIYDRCNDIVSEFSTLREQGLTLSADACGELNKCFTAAKGLYSLSTTFLSENSDGTVDPVFISKAKNKLHKAIRQFNKAHLKRVEMGKCTKEMTGAYSEILYNVDRIGDNCVGISEEVLDHAEQLKLLAEKN